MAPARKYGKQKTNHQLFSLKPLLQSPSNAHQPRASADIDDLAAQFNQVHIATPPRTQSREQGIRQNPADDGVIELRRSPRRKLPTISTPEPGKDDDIADLLEGLIINDVVAVPNLEDLQFSETDSDISSVSSQSFTDEYTLPLLALSADTNNQKRPTSFNEWSNSIEEHFKIIKIAEASYGEVYRLVLKAAHPILTSGDESVLKILALKPEIIAGQKVSKARQKKESFMSTIPNVTAEIKLLQRMADIPGFTYFRDVRVLKGRPSKAFAQAWKQFNLDQSKDDKSIFPDPGLKSSYDEEQLWAVIEMQDAGIDLEHITLRNVFSVWDVFWGVALALAKGEQEAEFEHRDLHMGNICIKPCKEDEDVGAENAKIQNLHSKLNFTGLEPTIIDYTLSRAETIADKHLDGGRLNVEFMDLELDPDLFTADASEEYQYEIYRNMRSAMYFSKASASYSKRKAKATGRTWAGFHPQTNLVWLHFILHKMLTASKFVWPSKGMAKTLQYLHSKDKSTEKLARAKSRALEDALKDLSDELEIDNIPSEGLGSAADLIGLALAKGWLDECDIVGSGNTTLSYLLDGNHA